MALFRGKGAQASLEYLMTYGWALVLIATVVAVLLFIVSSPASEVFFSSSDPTKIIIKAGAVQGSDVEVRVQNLTGGDLDISAISETGYSGCTANGGAAPVSVSAGAEIVLECTSSSDGTGTITLDYTDFAGLSRVVVINGRGSASGGGSGGPQRFENLYSGDDSEWIIGWDTWAAQTFTPTQSHSDVSVKLLVSKDNTPGDFVVGIRATAGSGKPSASDLCSGSISGDEISDSPAGWSEISMEGDCDLEAGTKYAIVARAPTGGWGHFVFWRYALSGGYANGVAYSNNYGGQEGYWNEIGPGSDFLFEEWGTVS